MSKRQVGYRAAAFAITFALAFPALALDPSIPPARVLSPQKGGLRGPGPGYIGIDVRDISDDEVAPLKLHDARGAEIVRIDHDGPAGKMGLRERDVVLQMNGITIETEEQIRRLLRDTPAGKPVVFVISRDGQQQSMSTLMGDKVEIERRAWEQHLSLPAAPASAQPAGDATLPAAPTTKYSKGFLGSLLTSPTYTGAMLEMMGPQMAQFFGVQDGSGLLVRKVEANSPAAMAGLRLGDYVVKANQRPVKSVSDWTRIVRDAKGRPIALVVMRDKQEKLLTLTPDIKHRSELELPMSKPIQYHLACLTEL